MQRYCRIKNSWDGVHHPPSPVWSRTERSVVIWYVLRSQDFLKINQYMCDKSVGFPVFFWGCFAATGTQLERQLQLEHTHVVCSYREAQKRPARGHSRNGPWTWKQTHTNADKQHKTWTKHTSVTTQHGWTTHTRNSNKFSIQVYLIYLIVSLYISWFISCIGIIMISNIYLCYYLYCLDFVYICLKNIILFLFNLIFLFYLCVYIYR